MSKNGSRKANRTEKGIPIRTSNGEGDRILASVTFRGPEPARELVPEPIPVPMAVTEIVEIEEQPPPVNTPVLMPVIDEPIEVIKEKIRERCERLKAGNLTDDESAIQIFELQGQLKNLEDRLKNLTALKDDLDQETYRLAQTTIQSEIDRGKLEITAAIQKQPTVAIKIGEYNKRNKLADALLARQPRDVVADDIKSAQNILNELLQEAVAGGIFFNPPGNADVRGRSPIFQGNQYFSPSSDNPKVLALFDALTNFQTDIKEGRKESWKERDEAAMPYVANEETIRGTDKVIVGFYDLLTKPGLGRLAFVSLSYRVNEKPVGKVAITRRANNKVVAIKATTTVAAEMVFRRTRRDWKTREVKPIWNAEQELDISVEDDRNPDFSGIHFDPLRISLESAFKVGKNSHERFEAEIQEQKRLLNIEGQIGADDLLAGKDGVCTVHIKDWKREGDSKSYHLVATFEGKDGNLTVTAATPGSLKAAPFLRDYLGKVSGRDKILRDKRIWMILSSARDIELARRVNELFQIDPDLANIFKSKEAFEKFINGQSGNYFFGFEWRTEGFQAWVNAVLHLEDSKVSVNQTVGHFSEEFFRPLITEPKSVPEINGRIKRALAIMARRHFRNDPDNIPVFLQEKRDEGYVSLVGPVARQSEQTTN